MRDPATDPAVRRRMAMARYARSHNKLEAARHFGCCWTTIQAAVQRVERYESTGDIGFLQNKPRGKRIARRKRLKTARLRSTKRVLTRRGHSIDGILPPR
jgi:hypothetical protein